MKFDGKVKDFMMDLPYDVAGSILYALGVCAGMVAGLFG